MASITLTEDRSSHYQQKGATAAGSGSEEQPGALEGGQQQQGYNLPPLGMLGGVPNLGATLALQQHLVSRPPPKPQGSVRQHQTLQAQPNTSLGHGASEPELSKQN